MMEGSMTQREPSAAAAIYPHLRRAEVSTPEEPRRNTSPLAAAMYPNHVPKPPPPAPRPQATPQEVANFWATVDPAWAASIGLVKVGRR
jgi:hypothetical protein